MRGTISHTWEALQLLADAAARWTRYARPAVKPSLARRLVARAQPNECFSHIGGPITSPPCAEGSREKTNESYVWAAARSGDFLYFGTIANTACVGGAALAPSDPWRSENIVCEVAAGPAARTVGTPELGDVRPPRFYRLNTSTDTVEDITPHGDPLVASTIGLRGAGAHRDVVLLAGENLTLDGPRGLNIWAFEGSTGKLLGSRTLHELMSMRRGLVAGGELYLGVRRAGRGYGEGGCILKWTGNKTDPFRFEVVGLLGSDPGYFTEHEGRLAVGGWSGISEGHAIGEVPGLYLSPKLHRGGLTRADATGWKKIFTLDQYDPDPVVALATYFGDLVSWRGKLFFSTYQIPGIQTASAFAAHGRPETWLGRIATYTNAERATAVLVMDRAGQPDQTVRLLYGEEKLPAYDRSSRRWRLEPNRLWQKPAFGPSGFGNPFNKYSWTWTVFDDKLYMATADLSNIAPDSAQLLRAQSSSLDIPPFAGKLLAPLAKLVFARWAGGDIWRMDEPDQPAVAEDLHGFGNRYNCGMRVWVPFADKGKLYGGTANFFNLRTDAKEPGGWELLEFTPLK